MQPWRQHFYFVEFLLVAIPVALFVIVTPILLLGLATEELRVALKILPFWIGGCMGAFALWSMYFRLYKEQATQTFKELPYVTLGCGIVANAIPVLYFGTFDVTKPDRLIFSLALLVPIFVAIHWVFALRSSDNMRSSQNEIS
jgi:hypothetical protein